MSLNLSSAESGTPLPNIHSVRFDTTGYEAQAELSSPEKLVWFTPEGDALSITFNASPPDLPVQASTLDDLTTFYANLLQASSGRVVEILLQRVTSHLVVQTLVKIPQSPSGMTYVGALTLPFDSCSYVIKVQCPERVITGLREAVLVDRAMSAGLLPDTPEFAAQWNSDDQRYDAEFPDHPVSRARRVLKHILGSLEFDASIAALAPFRWSLNAT